MLTRHLLTLVLMAIMPLAQANVVITGTRVIYPAQQKEVSIQLSNVGSTPSLVQAWIDDGNDKAAPNESAVPFVLTPPIFRIDAGKGQTLRLIYTQEPLPQDRESVFYLNVLDIPPKPQPDSADAAHNFLQFSIRSRLKLFYRPQGLRPDISKAAAELTAQWDGHMLTLTNPTPYFMSISSIQWTSKQAANHQPVPMIAPFESVRLPLTAPAAGTKTNAVFINTINDFGGISENRIMFH